MSDPTPQPVINYAGPGMSPPRTRRSRGLFGWVLFIVLAVLFFVVLQSNKSAGAAISLSEFTDQLNGGNVSEVIIDGDLLRGRFNTPISLGKGAAGTARASASAFRVELPPNMSQNWAFVSWLLNQRQQAVVRVENNQSLLGNLLLPLIPWLLIFGFIWFFVFRRLRVQQGPPKPIPVYMAPPENS